MEIQMLRMLDHVACHRARHGFAYFTSCPAALSQHLPAVSGFSRTSVTSSSRPNVKIVSRDRNSKTNPAMADFDWPWEYNFPPFFTLQPNNETRSRQLTVWNSLARNYHRHRNQSSLDINEDTPLFCNNAIKRRLPAEGRLAVLEHLQGTGHAAPLDKRRTNWQVYWHTLDEWAKLIHDWAQRTGQTNTVCTIYEIAHGDNSVGEEFHELDQEVILKALKLLEAQSKCELMLFDDNQGVKFF